MLVEPVVIDDLKVDIHGGLLRTLRAEDTDDGRQILALLDSAPVVALRLYIKRPLLMPGVMIMW